MLAKHIGPDDIHWCCKYLTFMVENDVAEPIVDALLFERRSEGRHRDFAIIGHLKGIRMKYHFFLFPKDRRMWECPFCGADLVRILDIHATFPLVGYIPLRNQIPPGPRATADGGLTDFQIPMSALEKALRDLRQRRKTMREARLRSLKKREEDGI